MQSPNEMRTHLEEKAFDNLEFRAQLVADPKATIEQEFGIAIPEGIEVEVHESTMSRIHVALPPSGELQEEQLAAVAGGFCVGGNLMASG